MFAAGIVGKMARVNRFRRPMSRFFLILVLMAGLSLAIAGPSLGKPSSSSGGYTLVENSTVVSPGNASQKAAQVTSTGPDPFTWGAVDVAIPTGLRLRGLTNLSTDYKFVVGSCWGGSPRFEAWVTDPAGAKKKIFFYIGPASQGWTGCPSGVYANTGNLATPTSTVDAGQLGGPLYQPYSDVQARYGNYPVTHVYLDVDGGWQSNQTVDFDNTVVNRNRVSYEG
jgi:hypothetical protein